MDQDNQQDFEIHRAALQGEILIVKGLLKSDPKLAILKDNDGRSPLHWAVLSQHTEIVKLLLNPSSVDTDSSISGGNGNIQQQQQEETTTTSDTKKTKKKLIIDIDELTDESGWTPLHIASSIGNLEIFEILMNHDPKPDVNLQTITGQTPLHYAVSKNNYQICEILIVKYNASARIKDKRGQYPIHRAASIGSIKLIELLVNKGKSQLNSKDNSSWTPMHHALAEGHGDIGLLLVKLGADPKIKDSDDKTPLDVSVDDKVAKFFKKGCEEEGVEL